MLIHLEEVPVSVANHVLPETADRIGKVEVNGISGRADTTPLVANDLRIPGGHIPRNQVPERRVTPFEVVVPLVVGDLGRQPTIAGLLRDPDPPIVA